MLVGRIGLGVFNEAVFTVTIHYSTWVAASGNGD